MKDKELADKVVALGVAARSGEAYALIGDGDDFYTYAINKAESFVRDWRVAGALMERLGDHINYRLNLSGIGYSSVDGEYNVVWLLHAAEPEGKYETIGAYDNKSLPRAINEACVKALT